MFLYKEKNYTSVRLHTVFNVTHGCEVTGFLRDVFAGDAQNGHARFSPSDEQEVPITMKSNADFTAVQQKLATKKPFYKGISSVFK